VEVQASGEEATFAPRDLARLVRLAQAAGRRLAQVQDRAARAAGRARAAPRAGRPAERR